MEWSEPAPLEDYLIPTPFDQLSFYPPGFREAVEAALPYRGQTEVTDFHLLCENIEALLRKL